jgi:hypothetical protein
MPNREDRQVIITMTFELDQYGAITLAGFALVGLGFAVWRKWLHTRKPEPLEEL